MNVEVEVSVRDVTQQLLTKFDQLDHWRRCRHHGFQEASKTPSPKKEVTPRRRASRERIDGWKVKWKTAGAMAGALEDSASCSPRSRRSSPSRHQPANSLTPAGAKAHDATLPRPPDLHVTASEIKRKLVCDPVFSFSSAVNKLHAASSPVTNPTTPARPPHIDTTPAPSTTRDHRSSLGRHGLASGASSARGGGSGRWEEARGRSGSFLAKGRSRLDATPDHVPPSVAAAGSWTDAVAKLKLASMVGPRRVATAGGAAGGAAGSARTPGARGRSGGDANCDALDSFMHGARHAAASRSASSTPRATAPLDSSMHASGDGGEHASSVRVGGSVPDSLEVVFASHRRSLGSIVFEEDRIPQLPRPQQIAF